MHQHSQRRRKPALYLSVGAVALTALGIAPAGAFASTISQSADGTLTFSAQGTNRLTITQAAKGDPLMFSDSGTGPVAISFDPATGCSAVAAGVSCPAPTGPNPDAYPLHVALGSYDDVLDDDTFVRSRIEGGDGSDSILGSHVGDQIDGDTGRDTIDAREGNDSVNTWGNLPDTVRCGTGNDYVIGDAADTIASDRHDAAFCEVVYRRASAGDPQTGPVPGGDTAGGTTAPGGATAPSAGGGQVVPQLIPGACKNEMDGTDAINVLKGTRAGDNILAFAGNDQIDGLAGDDCLFGGLGNDRLSGGAGRDFVSGEAGNDLLSGGTGADGVSGGLGKDVLSGGSGNDKLAGDQGADVLFGNAGADTLYGGAGNDRLVGGAGRNAFFGGAGRDTIDARNGVRDRVDCGTGKDVVRADARDKVARNCEVVKRS